MVQVVSAYGLKIMREKKVIVKKTPTLTIKGDKIKQYVEIVTKLIKGGKTSKFYPDITRICNLFYFLVPENNYNLYDSIEINQDTGLPTEKDITRVVVDRNLAPDVISKDSLQELEKNVKNRGIEADVRRLNRWLYHNDILKYPLPAPLDLILKLRMIDTDKYTAFFNAEVERFDLASEMFAKYTLVVGQKDIRWKSPSVQVVGDDLKYTEKFRNTLSECTVNEAEFAFILLNDLPAVVIEEVQRCRIGPLYFNGVRIPEGMEEIFDKHLDTFILSLPSDRASIHIKEDRNNDPLVQLYRDTLTPENRELRDEKAEVTGYHVFKERKFVCTRNALNDFRKFLAERSAKCVVYGV
jgi:hypothetical protein